MNWKQMFIVWRKTIIKQTAKRAAISVILFVVVYFGAGLVTRMPVYDGLVKTLEFMSAVIAAGCYWIGSNNDKK